MVKANVIPGKFLSCLLGIFIGILLTLGGLVGGGFYVYKNVKVGSCGLRCPDAARPASAQPPCSTGKTARSG